MNNSVLTRNKEVIFQLLKSVNEPIAIINREFNLIFANKLFSSLIESEKEISSIKDLLQITPSLTAISQNYFSDKINALIKLIPIELEGKLEGFQVFIEKNDDTDYPEDKKLSFRAAAHDLNNILTNIINSIDLLKQNDNEVISQTRLLNIIENSTNRAADIISTVLSKNMEKNSSKSQINLNALLEEIATSFKLFLPNRISFDTNIQFGLPNILGNYTDLYRSVYNLLINAKEAVKGNGNISLSASQILPFKENNTNETQRVVSIKIADNGVGISSDNLNKIFNDNYSTKNTDKVSGIGLKNVKEIIENQKGRIIVKSEEGKGTMFEIQLPVLENKKGPVVEEFRRILIAEDEDTLRELLKDLFESHEFQVSTAKDGFEVINIIEKDPFFDLLIIDKKMPNMDGLESIEELNRLGLTIPIILATGSSSEEMKTYEQKYNITQTIKKPYRFDELLSIVNKIL